MLADFVLCSVVLIGLAFVLAIICALIECLVSWLLQPVGGNILKPFGRMPTNGH